MTADFSIRQLLACLNISVFNPVMDPALKKVCQIETKQEAESKSSFYTTASLTGMASASFLCFYGLRAYSFPAGAFLFAVCGFLLRKTTSDWARFFLRTYFFSGLLLLTEAMFSFSPVAMTLCLFFFLARSLFSPADRWARIILSVLFFSGVCFLYLGSLSVVVGVFSLLGTAGLLFPLKNVYGRESGIVFTVLPLLLILGDDVLSLLNGSPSLLQNWMILVVFAAELLLLFAGLWRDMEINELFLFVAGGIVLSVCGGFLSAGLQGCIVLFLIAFFIDSPVLGKIAAFLFSCFLTVFALSMTVSFFSAAMICAVTGVFFKAVRRHLRRIASKGR